MLPLARRHPWRVPDDAGSAAQWQDETAAVYERHAPALIKFATSLVGPDHAADVLSSAVVKAISTPGWTDVGNHRAYLYRAVFNEAKSWHRSVFRRRDRERSLTPTAQPGPDAPQPEVLQAVARLSVRQRAVVVLTYWADLDPAGVAGHLGISEGAVRSHLARARARLRKALRD